MTLARHGRPAQIYAVACDRHCGRSAYKQVTYNSICRSVSASGSLGDTGLVKQVQSVEEPLKHPVAQEKCCDIRLRHKCCIHVENLVAALVCPWPDRTLDVCDGCQ